MTTEASQVIPNSVSKVVLTNGAGEILLLRRSAASKRRALEWDIPGGHVDDGESALDAAIRETSEEAGIPLQPEGLALVYGMTEMGDETTSVTWLFYSARTDVAEVILSHEHCESAWKSLTEAVELIDYNRQKKALNYILEHGLLPVYVP